MSEEVYYCSFCGQNIALAECAVKGWNINSDAVHICADCVSLCVDLIREHREGQFNDFTASYQKVKSEVG